MYCKIFIDPKVINQRKNIIKKILKTLKLFIGIRIWQITSKIHQFQNDKTHINKTLTKVLLYITICNNNNPNGNSNYMKKYIK